MKNHPKKKNPIPHFFDKIAGSATKAVGKPIATIIAILIIIIWGLTGSAFHYSDTWQLVINTGTTIITFIIVLEEIKKFYIRLSGLANKHNNLFTTHSIDEADKKHERKQGAFAVREEAIMKHSNKKQ